MLKVGTSWGSGVCLLTCSPVTASIPLAVKREVMALIRQYLDKQFE